VMITVFLFLTAPVTAHMVAKAHILRDRSIRHNLPPPPCGGWATLGKEASLGKNPS
jgi:multicomponent K+:H+ antiporter subunit G